MTTGVERAVHDLRKTYSPYPVQRKFHANAAPYPFLGGAAGPGKLLRLDEPVPIPSGWSSIGALAVGDTIFDMNGQQCRVIGLSPIDPNPESWRIRFDDGATVDCCSDHLWVTYTARELEAMTKRTPEYRSHRKANRPSRKIANAEKPWVQATLDKRNRERVYAYAPVLPSVRSTADIVATLRVKGRANHAIPVCGAVDLPEIHLPLDPYCLGAWLGDGSKGSGGLTGLDAEVWQSFERAGFVVRHRKDPQSHSVIGLCPSLRAAGVFKDKHVPAMYLRGSIGQRLALLQGFMDTDGGADEAGYCEFCNTNRSLAEGVLELALSLGIKAKMAVGRATLYGKDCGAKYRVTFTTNLPVFRIARKLARISKPTRRTTRFRYIVDAERIDSTPMRCIKVDSPTETFLVSKRFIPTHNTTALIMENLISVNEFNLEDGKQVQTLMLRRTQPMVRNTLLTRFREKIDSSLYRKFNETSLTCTWLNGAVTQFGSMQYESDVYGWQGQWKDIYYDEICDFTWGQWANIAAWNRCPVSPYARRLGAGNPVGVGAGWVRKVWVEHKPWDEMDAHQRRNYKPEDYAYFPCTYLDNPIFANDPQFIAGLMSLPERLRMALMEGSWDVTGGYFTGAFDTAFNVIEESEFRPEPWHRQWISGDWGFEHYTALYRHYMDDYGVIRTGREMMIQHHDPEMLGERIVSWLVDEKGNFPKIQAFPFSHDAFASTTTKTFGASANSVAMRLGAVLKPYGIPLPLNSGKDKLGREQTMYNLLRKEVWGGEKVEGKKRMVRNWLICDDCPKLIETLIAAPRDEKRPEMIAEFSGDDPLQGAGYGVYHIVGRPAAIPREEQVRRELAATEDPMANYVIQLREHCRAERLADGGEWWK